MVLNRDFCIEKLLGLKKNSLVSGFPTDPSKLMQKFFFSL